MVNFDAFIGKTIGSDIWPDWIFIDSGTENFPDRPIQDQTMEDLKPKIPNVKDPVTQSPPQIQQEQDHFLLYEPEFCTQCSVDI